MTVEVEEAPNGHWVKINGQPAHSEPMTETAARWLAADLTQDPGMADRSDHDLGHVYIAAATIRMWMQDGWTTEANALSISWHACGAFGDARMRMH